ncbi:rRNA-processing protein [Wickerhamomyces ciferrii]|uniref:rRNA-processing protein EFG1 n=1 Tax=Wickerhamomyces ciferrii (strain ATCC 14091 / BCRC 22168 / CBS 111 / JCM 3599 / NBRC 0793 / NRRL Y-1031 F-60-10) TaxID=1206466 RepID=K0K9R0_WICCF|nr:rRNA-processing protein [Wickerhamomyces ciferrii]CCH41660.1 rRNA-processing protein [Wickerhamomyces ciferrii]
MPPVKKQRRSNGVSVEVASVLGSGTSKINKKIRDIERLLNKRRDKLPSNVIIENERALQALKTEKLNVERSQKVKKISKKYHMVRFFERKKALRKYKQAKKQYDSLVEDEKSDKKEIKKAKKVLGHCEIDLLYTVNFPKDIKYISLYPSETSEDLDESTKKGLIKTEEDRNSYKKQFEKMLKEGTIPVSIDDILKGDYKLNDYNEVHEAPDSVKHDDVEEEEDDFFE